MWTIIVFVFITVASSTNVQYDHTGEIAEVLKDTFGLTVDRTQDSDEDYSFEVSRVRQSKMFDIHPNHRQVTTGPEEPFGYHQYDKHWHRHDHRGGGNRHVNCEDHHENDHTESTIREINYNMDTTESSIKRKTELNTLRPKNKTNNTNTHAPKVNPVRENVTHTTQKTANNGQVSNTTKVSSDSRKISIEDNKNATASEEANKGNTSYIDGDRWIWVNGSTQQLPPNTTTQPTTVGLGDRAAFSGDGCATGQVKVGNTCVDED